MVADCLNATIAFFSVAATYANKKNGLYLKLNLAKLFEETFPN